MKICLVGEYSARQWTGSATFKVQKYVLRELSKENEVILYELPRMSRVKKMLSPLIPINNQDGKVLTGGIINFSIYLIRSRFEIIHLIINRRYMLLMIPVLLLNKAKVILTLHDTLVFRNNYKSAEYYLKYILIAVSRLVFVYNNNDKVLISKYKDPAKIIIIRNGVDLELYSPAEKKSCKNIITFAGGLGIDIKGLFFLELSLLYNCNKYHLEICGENKYNLQHPLYLGELDEKDFIIQLRKSSLVIIPSIYDSFGLTVLEAMASGIPVIVTNSTGAASYLQDGYDCIKIDYGDTDALLEAVLILTNNIDFRNKLINNGLTTVNSFTWDKIIPQYQEYYKL